MIISRQFISIVGRSRSTPANIYRDNSLSRAGRGDMRGYAYNSCFWSSTKRRHGNRSYGSQTYLSDSNPDSLTTVFCRKYPRAQLNPEHTFWGIEL